ncbi:phage antirepressor N-terminal domain-containing protein [Providencia rettgeri]|uniref:phage antirepressor N-terminal domain-containing protein n=1 Tax=Providencia sp. 1709051003 TaxID=2603246 RepID=UPI0034D417BC
MSNSISTINVPFHGNNLYVVNYNGQPYVPMRPIVEGMGMDWTGQLNKLKQKFKSTVEEISIVAADGKERNMICLALRKLAGWLHTISPNKVKPEIRDKVIQYQEECDDVLYEYWTTGEVKAKPRKQVKQIAGRITSEQQEAIKQLVLNRGKALPKEKQAKAMITMWSSLKSHFGCTYKEIDSDKFTEALSLAARVPLEGEYIPKQQLPQVGLESLAMPMSFFDEYDWLFKLEGTDKDEALSSFYKYPQKMLKNMAEYPNPLGKMLTKLSDAGVNVDAAWLHLRALKHNYEVNTRKLNSSMSDGELSRLLVVRNRFDKALSLWKDNLCRNLIRMDVPSAVPFNQAVTDAISELRFITDKLSERLIA